MGSVYKKGAKLWVEFSEIVEGKKVRRQKPTQFRPGEEDKARELVRRIEESLAAGRDVDELGGPVTVRRWAARWVRQRKELGISDADNDDGRLKHHVLPKLGDLVISEVRARHLADLFTRLRASETLAPKSIWNVYGVTKAMFRDAKIAGLVHEDPCCLTVHQLGPIEDADPEWRDGAIYTRDELETLISDPRIPEDRRVLYALEGLAALRHGEAAGLRWKHVDLARQPLGELLITTSYDKGRTKTRKRRFMPVHPTLQTILAEWKLSGWAGMFGRPPADEDLVVPLPAPTNRGRRVEWGGMRTTSNSHKRLKGDLELLGFRHRRGHDLRRTFLTLAQEDGADESRLYRCTHNPKGRGTIVERYTSHAWKVYCAEVARLLVVRRQSAERPVVVPLRASADGSLPSLPISAQIGPSQPTSSDLAGAVNGAVGVAAAHSGRDGPKSAHTLRAGSIPSASIGKAEQIQQLADAGRESGRDSLPVVRKAVDALRAGKPSEALAHLLTLLPQHHVGAVGPMREVEGVTAQVRGGSLERLLPCGHEVFVPSAHKPGSRRRRHCPECKRV